MSIYPLPEEHHYRRDSMDQRLGTSTPGISHVSVHSPSMAFPSAIAHLDTVSLNHSQTPHDFQWSHCDVKTHRTTDTYAATTAPPQYYARSSLPGNLLMQNSAMSDSRHWQSSMVPDPNISTRWTAAPIIPHSMCALPPSCVWPHTPDFVPVMKLGSYEVWTLLH